jgi:DNA-binding response OmpR family regulator
VNALLHAVQDEFDRRDARIADLEAEVARLRMAASATDPGIRVDLQRALGLPAGAATFLAALYDASGRIISIAKFDEMVPARGEGRGTKAIVRVYVDRFRRALGREAIVNHHGKGYSLSAAGRAKCDAALSRAGEEA